MPATSAAAAPATGNGNGNGNGGPPGGTSQAVDPGVRGGPAAAGGPIAGLTTNELNFFNAAQKIFEEVDAVPDGLGPGFNGNSCAQCHAQPSAGGSSPATNPQVALATLDGAHNTVPPFITANGPVRETRFVKNADGTPDGGVHDIYTIAGRSDAGSCAMAQPDYATQVAANNVIFRIPTPTFGLGLVENTSDVALQASFNATGQQRAALGISGNFNVTKEFGISGLFNNSGNTGNITRFGWKAQNPSLLVFAAEAYNVEQGVTNDGFPNERNNPPPECLLNPLPESTTNLVNTTNSASQASDFSQDIVNQAAFMRMLAPPAPASSGGTPTAAATTTPATTASSTTAPATTASATTTPSTTASATTTPSTTASGTTTPSTTASATTTPSTTPSSTSTTQVASANSTSVLSAASGTPSTSSTNTTGSAGSTVAADASQGQQVFQNIGCAACHTPSLTTGNSQIGAAETNVTYHPFSDFAIHDMGTGLADGVSQGAANGQQFRTAPLWGVGQRIFFLHDGRTNNLVTAIEDHASQGSEANTVVQNFNMLSTPNQQALIDYLRSL